MEVLKQAQAVLQRTTVTQLIGIIMGCLLLLAAMGLGAHMILGSHRAGHTQNEWYFVGGLALMGGLSLYADPIIRLITVINPFKRGGDK